MDIVLVKKKFLSLWCCLLLNNLWCEGLIKSFSLILSFNLLDKHLVFSLTKIGKTKSSIDLINSILNLIVLIWLSVKFDKENCFFDKPFLILFLFSFSANLKYCCSLSAYWIFNKLLIDLTFFFHNPFLLKILS